MKARRDIKRAKGQGLVEGSVAVSMIIGAGVIATLMVLNSGACMFFKEKLATVTTSAAQYAAAHSSDSDVKAETTAFVQNLMPQVGLTPNNLVVGVSTTSVGQSPGVQVTINNLFPLFGGGTILPTQMTLADSEVVVW